MSGRSSIIEIDADTEIRKIIGQLDGLRNQIGAPKLLKNALNSTARKVRKQFVKDAQGRYAVKDKSIFKKEDQGAPKLYTASPTNLTATIVSKGPMQDIMSFLTRPNLGTGAAAAQVLNSGSLKPLELEGLLGPGAHPPLLRRGPGLPLGPLGAEPSGLPPLQSHRRAERQGAPRRQQPLIHLSVPGLGAEHLPAHRQAPGLLPLVDGHPEGRFKADRQSRAVTFHMQLSSLNIDTARSADNQGGRLLTAPGAGTRPAAPGLPTGPCFSLRGAMVSRPPRPVNPYQHPSLQFLTRFLQSFTGG